MHCIVSQTGPLPAEIDQFLLVVDEYSENIYQVTLHGETYQLPLGDLHRPMAVAYDRKEPAVFWTEHSSTTTSIRKYSLRKNTSETLYSEQKDANKGILPHYAV